MDFILDAPINGLSFGNVSYGILRELWRRDANVHLLPLKQFEPQSFPQQDKDFWSWVNESAQNAHLNIKKDMPSFKLWHISGSHERCSAKQALFTFYEMNQPTEVEKNLLNLQDKVFVSSNYSSNILKKHGIKSDVLPLGFDNDFHKTNKKYLDTDIVHFCLMGKFEKRKHTEKIIKLWCSKYGNNNKYLLTLLVDNPFFQKKDMNNILQNCFEGKNYSNVNILPRLNSNLEVNELLNSIDIDLTGLSGAEGWNLPSFNATCLGKWSLVLNETAHKDWATKENSILVESNGEEESYDGKFFIKGAPFNQGTIYTWDRDNVAECMDIAVSKKGQINTAGEDLKNQFSYSNTVDRLLKGLEEIV